jgi:transposase-like protein
MPAPESPEVRRRAVELARRRDEPVAEIARDLGISESCPRRWMVRRGRGPPGGLSSDERAELVRRRREDRVPAMEIEVLERASADSARENVLPKQGSGRSEGLAPGGIAVAVTRRVLGSPDRAGTGGATGRRRAGDHRRGAPGVAGDLPGAAGARRAAARPRPAVRPTGGPADARRRGGAIVPSDRGSQHTSWIFGHRPRTAGLLGSMRRGASSADHTMRESPRPTLRREPPDRRTRTGRAALGSATSERSEVFHTQHRRHPGLGHRTPLEYEALHTDAVMRHDHHTHRVRQTGSGSKAFDPAKTGRRPSLEWRRRAGVRSRVSWSCP